MSLSQVVTVSSDEESDDETRKNISTLLGLAKEKSLCLAAKCSVPVSVIEGYIAEANTLNEKQLSAFAHSFGVNGVDELSKVFDRDDERKHYWEKHLVDSDLLKGDTADIQLSTSAEKVGFTFSYCSVGMEAGQDSAESGSESRVVRHTPWLDLACLMHQDGLFSSTDKDELILCIQGSEGDAETLVRRVHKEILANAERASNQASVWSDSILEVQQKDTPVKK